MFSGIESKFNQLLKRAETLSAFEASGLKKACEALQAKLKECQESPQSASTLSTLQKMLDGAIPRVESWVQAEAREEGVSEPQIQSLMDSLSGVSRLLKKPMKREIVQTQEIEADLKVKQDGVEEKALSLSHSDLSQRFMGSSSRKKRVDETDLTLLKEQLTQLERSLMEAAQGLVSQKAELEKQARRVKNGKVQLNALQSKPQELAEHVLQMQELIEASRDFLREEPVILDEESQAHLNASAGEAFLVARGNKDEFYAHKESRDQKTEIGRLHLQNQTLAGDLKAERALKEEAIRDLAEALEDGEALSQTNQELMKDLKALRGSKEADDEIAGEVFQKQLQVVAENKRLTENLLKEGELYSKLEAEARVAREAKREAEASKAWAIETVDAKHAELQREIKRREEAESALALKSAKLERVLEDLKALIQDVAKLAEGAEGLKGENDKLNTELQYPYLVGKCDDLKRRTKVLLERARAAEKEARQAGLDAGYQASRDQKRIHDLESQVATLQTRIVQLDQECNWLKGQDPHDENKRLKEKLSKERATKFSDVLGRFDNAAAQAAKKLGQIVEAQKVEIAELQRENAVKAVLEGEVQEGPVTSKWAGRIKTVAIGAGLVLAAIATVVALGFLGAAAVTYALPILGIGLAIAAGGWAISKVLKSREATQRTALAVKATLGTERSTPSENNTVTA